MNDPFVALGVSEQWSERLKNMGITDPVEIQTQAVPELLSGADAVIRSGTGTGKTLAYLLPIAERLEPSQNREQAMILAPTAELAMQIVKVATELFTGTELKALGLIGGASVKRQLEKLKSHPQLVVGTPGRIVELLKINKLKTSGIKMAVIDEADQTFALGAGGEAEFILKSLPNTRQIIFCSATMPEEARQIAGRWMNEPRWIEAQSEGEEDQPKVPSTVEHALLMTEERDKVDAVRRLIRTLNPASAMVFINDTDQVAEVEAKLQFMGLKAAAIYGDQPKLERAASMRRFREGTLPYLIATDVAARGLDAPGVTLVIHFDPPTDAKAYLHRAGRTGRMGRHGTSVMLLTPKQRFIAGKMEKELGIAITEKKLYQGEFMEPGRAGGRRRGQAETGAGTGSGIERGTRTGSGRGEGNGIENGSRNGTGNGAEPGTERGTRTGSRTGTGRGSGTGKSAGPARPRAQSQAKAQISVRKEDRHRDRKNKGAPRWLKEKRNASKQGDQGGAQPQKP